MVDEKKEKKLNFTYTITNDGSSITKRFDGEAEPREVVLTLLTVLIDDVKHNINPESYKEFLDFIGTQYASKLMPDLLTKNPEEDTTEK